MGEYVASQVVKLMIKKGVVVNGANLLMLGITFKENCPDVRNTKIVDVISALTDYGIKISIYDPWANPKEVHYEYKLVTTRSLPNQKFDAVVLGVAHNQFATIDYSSIKKDNAVLYDVKGILGNLADGKL
jgi:UDP-N-acetyl-D-glucosamine/UDP-N-acetyl-D-galactosamine dehydrogenase